MIGIWVLSIGIVMVMRRWETKKDDFNECAEGEIVEMGLGDQVLSIHGSVAR
jgi:hypothetical protein